MAHPARLAHQGQAIYDALKGNPNLFLMLGGHLDIARQRTDTFNGNTVYSLRSDYQFVDSQQSGYLRIMRFSPVDNMIHVSTYSPTQYKEYPSEIPENNFSLPYTMNSTAAFTLIGTASNVPAGTDASITWTGLAMTPSMNGMLSVAMAPWKLQVPRCFHHPGRCSHVLYADAQLRSQRRHSHGQSAEVGRLLLEWTVHCW